MPELFILCVAIAVLGFGAFVEHLTRPKERVHDGYVDPALPRQQSPGSVSGASHARGPARRSVAGGDARPGATVLAFDRTAEYGQHTRLSAHTGATARGVGKA